MKGPPKGSVHKEDRRPLVCVATITHYAKEYALPYFVAAYHALQWPLTDLFFADTSLGGTYARDLQLMGLDVVHIEPSEREVQTNTIEGQTGARVMLFDGYPDSLAFRGWKAIATRAEELRAPLVLYLDSDLIVPPDTISVLYSHLKANTYAVAHAVPVRTSPYNYGLSAGFMLIPTKMLRSALEDYPNTPGVSIEVHLAHGDQGNWGAKNGHPFIKLWQSPLLEHIVHLDGFGRRIYDETTPQNERYRWLLQGLGQYHRDDTEED